MFSTQLINDQLHVAYNGSDDKDLVAFYDTIHTLPESCCRRNGFARYIVTTDGWQMLLQRKCKLKLSPYAYQEEAIDFVMDKRAALIMACCGAGKTVVAIGAYAKARELGIVTSPGIMVVKASLKKQWEQEIIKFSHFKPQILKTKSQLCSYQLTKLKKEKDPKKRALIESEIESKFMEQFYDADLFVTNYEALTDSDIKKALHQFKIQFVNADEIHYAKNHKAKRTQAVYEFSDALIKMGSTATPIQKDYCDIYGIFRFLLPFLYKSFSEFATRHIQYASFGKIAGFRNIESLMIRLKPYLFIKTEEDIASQLPQMMAPIQYWCDLDPKIQAASDVIMEDLAELKEREKALAASFSSQAEYDNSPERMQLEGQIMALQTFAQEVINAPELLEQTASQMAKRYCITGKYVNVKLDLLAERVAEIIDSGEKVCIFSKYERIQSIIEARLVKDNKDLVVAKVHGGLNSEERFDEVYVKFKNNPNCSVLLGSNAMAEGINLGFCKYLIEYDLAESYAIQTQRHGRIRRADSTHKILFVYQILAYKSWDEIAVKIVGKKETMDAQLKS